MHVLSIDAGAYSIKYLSSFLDKRHATHAEMREFPLAEALETHPEWGTLEETSMRLMERIVSEVARPDTRIILHVPPEMVTTRFLTLPVKNRKKAEAMIPFQLEEDIPFALSEAHYAWQMEIGRTQAIALVALTRETEFATFHERITQWPSPPAVVTSEPSVFDAFYGQNVVQGPFCVLDIGHRGTKAYFFYNSKLIATHVSYVGGRHVDEMIAQTYSIPADEAVLYKHQNAFVLTQAQTAEVDDNQREFASLMDQVFRPLVNDFLRWELGFRVTHGVKIQQVFICGGSANIKNLAPFLTERFAVKTILLESFEGIDTSKLDFHSKARAKFTLANMMALSLRSKGRLINLLSGRFAQASRGELPLAPMAFIGARVAIVSAVLALTLVIQGIFLDLDMKAVNIKMAALAKNPILKLTPRERRLMANSPAQTFSLLGKKQRAIHQQISTLQSADDERAIEPLVALSAAAAGLNVTLGEYGLSDGGEINAVFTATNLKLLDDLRARLVGLPFANLDLKVDPSSKTLVLKGVQ